MGRQLRIKGSEDKDNIPELTDAAMAYEEARDERMRLTESEDTAKQALITVMKHHKRMVYRVGDMTVTRESETVDKVKVKRSKDEAPEEPE